MVDAFKRQFELAFEYMALFEWDLKNNSGLRQAAGLEDPVRRHAALEAEKGEHARRTGRARALGEIYLCCLLFVQPKLLPSH